MKTKIKNLVNLLITLIVVQIFSSCTDYLNVDHLLEDRLSLDKVFSSTDYSRQWLSSTYSHLRHGDLWEVCTKQQDQNQFNFISDDVFYTDRDGRVDPKDIVHGTPGNYAVYRGGQYDERFLQASWRECYRGIYKASVYIHRIDENKQMDPLEVRESKAEARFLRAYYYFLLLRKYGPVPLMPDEGIDYTQDYSDLAFPRSDYATCAEFIALELAKAAVDLPLSRNENTIMKPTKGAALAARARVYLYAASPQYNRKTWDDWSTALVDNTGKRLLNEYDNRRWAKAAAAAKEVIELDKYRLYYARFNAIPAGNLKDLPGTEEAMKTGYTDGFYRHPRTITPGQSLIKDAADSDKPKQIINTYPGYDDHNFGSGGVDCGWADIDPVESYRQLFDGTLSVSANPELIFSRGYDGLMNDLSIHQTPTSLNGWNCHGLTLKIFEAYYMADGTDYKDSPYYRVTDKFTAEYSATDKFGLKYSHFKPLAIGVSLQNANREPRFYASVAFNGSIWENERSDATKNARYAQVFYYRDSPDGQEPTTIRHIWTGIGMRKYYCPEYDLGRDGAKNKAEPAIRYAEVLLTYAEALNELTDAYDIPAYDGNGTIHVERSQAEISRGIRPVRVRGGLTDFTPTYYGDVAEMRTRIQREWQIEFMGEGHRYWDLRRWGLAEREEKLVVEGYNMNMTGEKQANGSTGQRNLWHTIVDIPEIPAIYTYKQNLWPISHDELRRNRKLTQNPGWTTFDE